MFNKELINAINQLDFRFPVARIAKDLNVSKGTVSSYLSGKIKASKNFIDKVTNFYELDLTKVEKETNDKKAKLSESQIDLIVDALWNYEDELKENKLFNRWLENKILIAENSLMNKIIEKNKIQKK